MSRFQTTINEDKILDACQTFGGTASDCVDIVERLDEELSKAIDRISDLETELQEAKSHE